jgi:hypothetical protein
MHQWLRLASGSEEKASTGRPEGQRQASRRHTEDKADSVK